MSTPHPLSSSHPLVTELSALRHQLAQYQRAAHQASIQVQGTRLELELTREEGKGLKELVETLKTELEVLRGTPDPPAIATSSTALTELSLAHRRLSSKLDLTEHQLRETQLELAQLKQQQELLEREREGDLARVDALRKRETEWAAEVAKEKNERRRVEEQKKLCDLALQEYSTLVKILDPTAVPPAIPPCSSTDSLPKLPLSGESTPSLSPSPDPSASTTNTAATTISSSEAISHLLTGQRGVNRLFNDFSASLATRDGDVHRLQTRVDELEHTALLLREQLEAETELRVQNQAELDRAHRDDTSAASIVERYMTFSQKSHQTVHMHLTQLRARSAATQASLRHEVQVLTGRLRTEVERGSRVRDAVDELSAELSGEVAGRRREVALRLKMIAVEEKRERKIEAWLDRVRRARQTNSASGDKEGAGAGGLAVDLDVLVDEGVRILAELPTTSSLPSAQDATSKRGWLRLLSRSGSQTPAASIDDDADTNPTDAAAAAAVPSRDSASVARVLLAEELVTTLVQDLQVETERRIELEKQRVDLLAREAEGGVGAVLNNDSSTKGGAGVVFDADADGDGLEGVSPSPSPSPSPAPAPAVVESTTEQNSSSTNLSAIPTLALNPLSHSVSTPTPSPEIEALREIFAPLNERFVPLQKTLHDQSVSLSLLRPAPATPSEPSLTVGGGSSSLPPFSVPPVSPSLGSSNKKAGFMSLSIRGRSASAAARAQDELGSILDGLHEVIEDARVDVEIALADEERVYHGFEALVGVGVNIPPPGSDPLDTGVSNVPTINVEGQATDSDSGVMHDAREYVEARMIGDAYLRLARRMEDVDHDLALIKRTMHEVEGMDEDTEANPVGGASGAGLTSSIWSTLPLRTVTPTAPKPSPMYSTFDDSMRDDFAGPTTGRGGASGLGWGSSIGAGASTRPRTASASAAGLLGSMGRTLSSGVMGAPRRVSGIAGLYRGQGQGQGSSREKEREKEKEGLVASSVGEVEEGEEGGRGDDDVE